MEQPKTKCNGCRCWREATAFIKNDKVMKTCNVCSDYREKYKNTTTKQYYIKNKESINQKHNQYYADNTKKVIQKQQQTYTDNKLNNPLKIKLKAMLCNSRTADKKLNRTYTEEDYITRDFLLSLYDEQQGKCFYKSCNCEMTLDFNKSCKTPTQISVQRLDNKIAHIKSNCVLSCLFCNCVKHMENCE